VSPRRAAQLAAALATTAALAAVMPLPAPAAGLEWRLQSIDVEGHAIELGRIGDLEFLRPNLGLLISAGSGQAAKPGVWAYNGAGWHQLSVVCGATDGRIAWVGPEEFWTVSDGRPGQAANSLGELPPLEDNTLCHFGKRVPAPNEPPPPLEVLTSYASLAFSASSYQAMDAAACRSAADCWFGGAPLPAPLEGAFELHWDGTGVTAEPNLKATAIGDMQSFGGRLEQSAVLPIKPPPGERSIEEILHPTILYEVTEATPPFKPLRLVSALNEAELLPAYASSSSPLALEYLHLGADADSLWAAAQARPEPTNPGESRGELTVLRESAARWTQVLGPPGPETVATTPESLDPERLGGGTRAGRSRRTDRGGSRLPHHLSRGDRRTRSAEQAAARSGDRRQGSGGRPDVPGAEQLLARHNRGGALSPQRRRHRSGQRRPGAERTTDHDPPARRRAPAAPL
jgi:hypothetical protein